MLSKGGKKNSVQYKKNYIRKQVLLDSVKKFRPYGSPKSVCFLSFAYSISNF